MNYQHIKRFRKGTTAKYHKYLQSDKWKSKAAKYKRRYPICEVCKKNPSEHVHHTNYMRVGGERGWDLIAICAKCHKEKHGIK